MKLCGEKRSKFRIKGDEHLDLVIKTVEMLCSGSQVEKSHAQEGTFNKVYLNRKVLSIFTIHVGRSLIFCVWLRKSAKLQTGFWHQFNCGMITNQISISQDTEQACLSKLPVK